MPAASEVLEVSPGQRAISTDHVTDRVQLCLTQRCSGARDTALALLVPQASDHRTHIPSRDGLREQGCSETLPDDAPGSNRATCAVSSCRLPARAGAPALQR